MDDFVAGFNKTAAGSPGAVTKVLGGAARAAKNFGKGLAESGKQSVSDTVKLKGLKHLGDAAERAGGLGKAFSTSKGRQLLAHGLGKAAPSLAVGGAYAAGVKKVYDKTLGGDNAPAASSGYGY